MRTRLPGPSYRTVAIVVLLVAGGLLQACGGSDGVSPPDSGQSLRFVPPPDNLSASPYDSLRFSVETEGYPDVSVHFVLDGDTLSSDADYVFVPETLGTFQLQAQVDLGGKTQTGTWMISVDTFVHEVSVFSAAEGPDPGTIGLTWERPARALDGEAVVRYEIAFSTGDFGPRDFDAQNVVQQDDLTNVILQRRVLRDLPERTVHFVSIRALDARGRRSLPSETIQAISTGHFDVTGRVSALRSAGQAIQPLGGVLLKVGDAVQVTGTQGVFALNGIPDLDDFVLEAQEQSGTFYYSIRSRRLEPTSRDFDLLLIQRGVVTIAQQDPPYATDMDRLDFLELMTSTNAGDVHFTGWSEYPVTLYVHPYVQDGTGVPGGEVVDYAAAFEAARDAWNEVAGEELLRVERIDQPLTVEERQNVVGAYYDTSLGGSSLLGKVSMDRPTSGVLYRDVPQLLRVQLRPEFNYIHVARWVIAHEIGHVLGLTHSPSLDHLMSQTYSSSQDAAPDPEEAMAARLLRHVTPDVTADWYVSQ